MEPMNLFPCDLCCRCTLLSGDSLVEEVSLVLEPFIHVLQVLAEVDVVHRLRLDAVDEREMLLDLER